MNVECEKHGQGVAATVCCHLIRNNGPRLGFIETLIATPSCNDP